MDIVIVVLSFSMHSLKFCFTALHKWEHNRIGFAWQSHDCLVLRTNLVAIQADLLFICAPHEWICVAVIGRWYSPVYWTKGRLTDHSKMFGFLCRPQQYPIRQWWWWQQQKNFAECEISSCFVQQSSPLDTLRLFVYIYSINIPIEIGQHQQRHIQNGTKTITIRFRFDWNV